MTARSAEGRMERAGCALSLLSLLAGYFSHVSKVKFSGAALAWPRCVTVSVVWSPLSPLLQGFNVAWLQTEIWTFLCL